MELGEQIAKAGSEVIRAAYQFGEIATTISNATSENDRTQAASRLHEVRRAVARNLDQVERRLKDPTYEIPNRRANSPKQA